MALAIPGYDPLARLQNEQWSIPECIVISCIGIMMMETNTTEKKIQCIASSTGLFGFAGLLAGGYIGSPGHGTLTGAGVGFVIGVIKVIHDQCKAH